MRSLSCPAVLLAVSLSASALAGTPSAAAAAPEVLPFIDNDYGVALAKAKAKGVPLFVDVWAPW